MTSDEIIKLAMRAGVAPMMTNKPVMYPSLEALETFAALVAAEKEKQIIDILERLQERNESHTYYKYAINVIKGEI
jgi:hypothetical protein